MKTKSADYIQKFTYTISLSLLSGLTIAQGYLKGDDASPLLLNYDNYIVPPTANYISQGANAGGVKVPVTGNNQKWDYSSLSLNSLYSASISYTTANSNAFSSARRKTSFVFPLGGFFIQETGYETDNNDAYQRLGRSIDRQAFFIGDLTGFLTDSLIISQQNAYDEGLLNFVAYPCTTSSSWSTSVRASTAFQLSLGVFGLDHTPGEFIQRQTLTRTVVGSGKMLVPSEEGKSKYVHVLMVRSVFSTIDSVYLGGAPAPPEILFLFGLTQGERLDNYEYVFLRPGIDWPLISFNMNEDFSSVNFISYDTRFVDIYCGKNKETICDGNGETVCLPFSEVTNILLQNNSATIGACTDDGNSQFANNHEDLKESGVNVIQVTAYPNPSSDVFNLKLNKPDNSYTTIRISDMQGRLITRFSTKEKEIRFGRELKPGVYFAEIITGNTKNLVRLVKL